MVTVEVQQADCILHLLYDLQSAVYPYRPHEGQPSHRQCHHQPQKQNLPAIEPATALETHSRALDGLRKVMFAA